MPISPPAAGRPEAFAAAYPPRHTSVRLAATSRPAAAVRAAVRRVVLPLLAVLLGLGLALGPWSWAQAEPIRRIGANPRSLALGGTGVSYANDEMGLYYNPAGLGAIDNWWVELLPFAIEASTNAIDLASNANVGTFDDPSQLIRDNIGKELYLRAFFYPTAVFNITRGVTLGTGYFNEVTGSMEIHNQATPEVDGFLRQDAGSVVGLSIPAAQGKYIFGIAARRVTRTQYQGGISSADLTVAAARGTLKLEDYLPKTSGSGTGYDLGLIWRLESFPSLRGQFGLAVQNVGGINLGEAGKVPEEISLGWSFHPQLTSLVSLLTAIEYRDVTFKGSSDTSVGKRTHIGLEVGIFPMDASTNLLTFRVGYGQAQRSYGFELALWHSFSLQFVDYFTEYGDTAGENPRERKLIQINVIGF